MSELEDNDTPAAGVASDQIPDDDDDADLYDDLVLDETVPQ